MRIQPTPATFWVLVGAGAAGVVIINRFVPMERFPWVLLPLTALAVWAFALAFAELME
jgi:hypothetical protein